MEQWINGPAGSHPFADAVMRLVAGQGAVLFIGLVVAWFLYGFLRSNAAAEAGATLAGIAAAAAFGVNQVLSVFWSRPRPFTSHPDTVHLLLKHVADSSFPSDHAAAGFAIAVVLAIRHRRVGVVVLAFAALMSYARVYVGNHYPGDVVAGAAVGVMAAALITAAGYESTRRLWRAVPSLAPRTWRDPSEPG